MFKFEDPKIKMYRVSKIELDSEGQLPTRIMILQTGDWPDSIKGDFAINLDDLKQIKENFDNKIGFPTADASTGLAIDFMHKYAAQAGAWIKGLELDADETTGEGKLFATPLEWTDAGSKAVMSGEFKMISPSGYFGRKNGKLSMWPNPQNMKEKVANVLDGAGLTNIPFLRGMSPIRADITDDGIDNQIQYDKVIFIADDQEKNKEHSMTLDTIRVKEADALSAEEKKFLLDNAADLSAEERTKFGIKQSFSAEGEEEQNDDPKDQMSTEDRELLDAIKSGNKKVVNAKEEVVTPERLSALEDTAKQYATEKAEQIIEAHVKRGAIKQDAAKNWTERLLASTGEGRTQLEEDLKSLPDNENLSKEFGSPEDTNAGSTGRDQLATIANEKVAKAAKDGKQLLYADALKEAIRENSALAEQDANEQKLKAGA